MSKIGKLIFNASAYTNSPKLSLYYKVGVTNIKNATDNKEDWIIADGIKRTFSEEYIAETLEIPVDVWNVNSGYLKIFLHHGTETQNMSCFMTNNYILAKPK